MTFIHTLEPLEPRRLNAFGDYDPTLNNGFLVSDDEFTHGRGVAVLTGGQIAIGRQSGGGVNAADQLAIYTATGVRTTLVDHVPFNSKNILKAAGTGVLVFTTTGVTKYTAAGAVDPSFGTRGSATITGDYNSVEVLPDDSFTTVAANYVTHYRNDGSFDSAFGKNGRLRFSTRPTTAGVTTAVETVNDVAVLRDGSVLVAGLQTKGTTYRSASTGRIGINATAATVFLQRYTPRGRLDTTFGDGGVVQFRVADPAAVSATTVQVLARSNGTAVLGYSTAGVVTAIAVDAAGRTRGPAGVTPAAGNLVDLYRQPDGGVLAVTGSGDLSLQKFTLVKGRWQAGPRVPGEGDDQYIADTDVDAQGRLVFAGSVTGFDYQGNLIVGRYDTTTPADPIQLGHFVGVQDFSLSNEVANVGLAYVETRTHRLRVALRTSTGRWQDGQYVDTAQYPAGTQLSLKLTGGSANGIQRAGLAYYDPTAGDLKYAYSFGINNGGNGQGFGSRTVDSAGDVGVSPSLVMDPNGRATIAYYDRTKGDLKFAKENTDDTWTISTIDAKGDTGRSPSLAYNDNTGSFAIAYAGPNGTLKLAEQKSGGWTTSVVSNYAGEVGGISLNFERVGPEYPITPRPVVIAYYAAASADLVIARRPLNRATFDLTTVAGRGATGLYPTIVQSPNYDAGYDQAVYWDRTHDAVRYGFDARFNATTGVKIGNAYESDTVLATRGGRYLSAVFAKGSNTNPAGLVLAYLDTVSGDVIVRDAGI